MSGDGAAFRAIETRQLSKAFGRLYALRRVDFRAEPGTVTGVAGPNGAGKSTLFNVLSTLMPPTSGELLFDGAPPASFRPGSRLRASIGMLGHDSFLYPDLTASENLAFYARLFHAPAEVAGRVGAALEAVGMTGAAGRRVKHCSRGMKQRIAFARLLVQDPQLWLLDEPATGLDVATREALIELIRDLRGRGKTIVVVSHDASLLRAVSDLRVYLERGRLLPATEAAGGAHT